MVEEDDPRPGPGEVRVRVLAAGVSFTDAQLRAGTYIPGGPKPPFTPGYELVGVVEELGPGCSRLREGDRIGALTVWGADAERVCVPEAGAVEVPEDLDPAEVVSLLFPYMTAYQVLHRTAMAKRGETVLVHGAAGQGRRRGTRAGSAGRASPLRDLLSSRPRGGRAARRGRDRLPQRGLPGAGARADRRRRRGRRARLARRPDLASLVPRAAAGRKARRVRPLRDALARAQGLASGDRVVRGGRGRVALGHAVAPPAGAQVPDPEVPRRCPVASRGGGRGAPLPGVVQRGLRACSSSCSARARSTRSSRSACRSPTRATRTSCSRGRHRRASSCWCRDPRSASPTTRHAVRAGDRARREGSEPPARPAGSATAVATGMSQKSEASTDVGRFE